MSEKKKLAADEKLIKKLFGITPLDWNRRPNGDLVFLNQKGQKFTYTDKQILDKINASGPKRTPSKPTKAAASPAPKAAQPAGAPPSGKPAKKHAGKSAAFKPPFKKS